MAAIIVQLKRLREAKRGPGKKDAKRGPQIVPLPNAGDVVLDASAYDEEVDDAVHAKRWTLLAAVDELVWGYQRAPRARPPGAGRARRSSRSRSGPAARSATSRATTAQGHGATALAVTRRYKRIFTGFGACFNYIFSVAAGARGRAPRAAAPAAGAPAPIARPTAQVELCWNMYAHWFWLFWGDGWNVFDFITVAVGWITEVGIELPGPLGMLRMVRALRVFRLFKRVKSLRKILEASRAVPGVANAFLIMLITMCIYAILAVDFFQAEGRDGVFHFESGATKLDAQRGLVAWANATGGATPRGARTSYCDARAVARVRRATRFWVDNFDGTGLIGDVPPGARGEWLAHHEKQVDGAGTYYTPRGNEWGHEYFGTFGKSLFTLFQVLTGDSWAEAIGRPLLEGWFPMSLDLDLPPPGSAPAPPAPAVAAPVARGAPAPAAAVDAELARVTAELAELKAAFASLEGDRRR
ncbi:hypothetical protein JL722_650 [Aureococcus anophagefferens]|nr:hypothetical protein JL722_650 [Aureococcus anophagefferens]